MQKETVHLTNKIFILHKIRMLPLKSLIIDTLLKILLIKISFIEPTETSK